MDFVAWIRKIQHALHECAESIRQAEERKRQKNVPVNKSANVNAVVSFDDKTVADTKAENERTYAT